MKHFVDDDWGDDGGLGPLLRAYADTRLRPDAGRARTLRAQLTGRARAEALAQGAQAAHFAVRASRPASTQPRGGLLSRLIRFPAAAAAAWMLIGALAVGGALAASGPGGLFYGPRLWVEELTLPSDPVARSQAQLARLAERLEEAEAAATTGNGAAVTAALDAYRAIADEALAAAGTDPTRREHLALELGRHVAVLQALVGEVPGRASEAIQAAVDRAEEKIEQILATPPGTPGAPANPAATAKPSPKGKPAATSAPAATPKPSPKGKPAATSAPAATPKPTPKGKPQATPAPAATPKPTPKPHPTPAAKPAPTPVPEATPRPTPRGGPDASARPTPRGDSASGKSTPAP